MTNTQDLLIEIGTEELPASHAYAQNLVEQLYKDLNDKLLQAQLRVDSVETDLKFSTPRRLAILFKSVKDHQPDGMIERKGPALAAAFDANGQPTPACEGFARTCGLVPEDLKNAQYHHETPKGTWLLVKQQQVGQSLQTLLPALLEQVIKKLPIAKPMRWGNSDAEFIRPVHWVVVLYNSEVIPVEILGKKSGNKTYGHRFHHPEAIELSSPGDYEKKLEQAYVIPDFQKRYNAICRQIGNDLLAMTGRAAIDEVLLQEITGLVEWPVALLAKFDEKFLDIPSEALISAMKNHQKSFPVVENTINKLLPYFITIANIDSKNPQQVIKGNERVMRARLSDAAFFYQQDCKQRLDSRLEALKHVVFHQQLGSLYDKLQRVVLLANVIAAQLKIDPVMTQRAALLSKADLNTAMVGEFPELQGIMGQYYALHDGEAEEVAIALNEYYKPRFSGDTLPSTDIAAAVALADRLDTLVGIFAIQQAPTGDKDPFALRRAALSVLRIVIEKKYSLNLQFLLMHALENYSKATPEICQQILDFINERLPFWASEQGFSANIVSAIMDAQMVTHHYDFYQRVQAVQDFMQLPAAQALAEANKRIRNILIKKQNLTDIPEQPNLAQCQLEAEKILTTWLIGHTDAIQKLCAQGQYPQALKLLAELQQPVDRFFTEVMVMVDDVILKNNRLALLKCLRTLFLNIADFSKIV